MGQDLDTLSMKEIQNLEQQLDTALKHIRSRKNQLMHESIAELQKKERAIQEQNNLLVKKIKEREKMITQEVQWHQQQQQQCQHGPPDPSSFLLSQPIPTLNMSGGYGGEMRRNDLDLSLEPSLYPNNCNNLGCFGT